MALRPLLFSFLLLGLSLPTIAADPGQKVVQNLVMLFSAWSGDSDDEEIYSEALRYIDYDGMAERSLGKPVWEKLSASQRQEFVGVFRKLIEQRYYERWHKIFYNGRLTYIGHTTVSGDTLIKTALQIGNEEDIVIWRLHPQNGDLAVVSLSVDETDLLSKLRERFQKHIAKKGFPDLLAWLKNKVEEESDDDKPSQSSTALKQTDHL